MLALREWQGVGCWVQLQYYKRQTNKPNFIKCLFIPPWVLDVSPCPMVKLESCINSTVLLPCSWPWETKLQKVTQPNSSITQKPSSLHKDFYCASDQFPLSFLGLILLQNKLWNVVASNNHFIISLGAAGWPGSAGDSGFLTELILHGPHDGCFAHAWPFSWNDWNRHLSVFTIASPFSPQLLSTRTSSQHGALKKDTLPGGWLPLEWLFYSYHSNLVK